MYQSTKILDGYSTCFRQWKADSHCRFLHGYAMKFKLTFESYSLDDKNWVQDFGFASKVQDEGLSLKEKMNYYFDHTTCIDARDPLVGHFKDLEKLNLIQLRVMNHGVGCERFAEFVYQIASLYIENKNVKLVSVECIENEKNSAIFFGK